MYARIVDKTTGKIKDVGKVEATRIIKKAEKTALQAMKAYEGEAVLYGSIAEDSAFGRIIYLGTPSVHSKKYIISAYKGNKHTKPLYALRKFKK